jgi:hypothetical protein
MTTEHAREPMLHATPVLDLRPTQMTIGMVEVALKRKSWKEENPKKRDEFLGAHMVPVVVGPGKERFLIDHHHLARALHEEGVNSVFVTIVADFHKLDPREFWNMMDFHGWTHPFDSKGRRRDYADLPKTIQDMDDDPYRSLAGQLRGIGGYAKDSTPFSEFVWADFLRRRIKPKDVRKDFSRALSAAHEFAKSEEASYLPGWCAPRAKAQPAAEAETGKAKKKNSPAKTADEN